MTYTSIYIYIYIHTCERFSGGPSRSPEVKKTVWDGFVDFSVMNSRQRAKICPGVKKNSQFSYRKHISKRSVPRQKCRWIMAIRKHLFRERKIIKEFS